MSWRTIEDIDPTDPEARRLRRNRLARERRRRAAGWIVYPFPVGSDTDHLDWILEHVGLCYEWLTEDGTIWIRRI